ncbi:acyltransferase family protein [Paenibacillus ginsengarvi]|uniref:Acetyltransferase n=1 Tax=Paenibacillus ginsengarvi TaxID=400777 RepID=A0A3B0CL24_9BACL|nr:acyltransferase family protein [Paenibacillus ginsengarvi]RKN85902.1 acetyltransferase [Paenibacillus ginsengarvi]
MPKPSGGGRYMAGLDGLRAIAVLAVIAYHLNPAWAPGGLLGVGVFFVLSGYLITDLLVAEWKGSGRIAMKPFLLRRARRLLPAMFVMLAAVSLWLLVTDSSRLASLQGDIIAAVLYVSNWWFVFHEVSYFESFGPPSPLGHLWSLAVEEQFYVVWPFVIALLLRIAPKRGKLFALIAAGAALSATAMAALYEPGADPSRVYYGTDTRSFGLLIGAALAVVWPSAKLTSRNVSPLARSVLDGIGAAALIGVLYMVVRSSEYDGALYRGGMVALSLLAALVVATLAHPSSRLGAVLGVKPLRWLGVRSYGIYLWHYPVIALTQPAVQTGGFGWKLALFQAAVSIGLAALSWRFVEEPIRRGAVGKLWMRLRNRKRIGRKVGGKAIVAAAGSLGALILFATCASLLYPSASASSVPSVATPLPQPETEPNRPEESGVIRPEPPGGAADHRVDPPAGAKPGTPVFPESDRKESSGATSGGSGSLPNPPSKETAPGSETKPDASHPAPEAKSGQGITVIGDSVILDAQPHLEKLLPGIAVDGKVGRQLTQAADLIEEMKSDNKLGSRVVIELGTNGAFPRKKLESLLTLIGKERQIILINTRVPRPWESEVNSTLEEVAGSFPNAKVLNWYEASADKDSYFSSDGVHLNSDGAAFYASLVANVLNPAVSG